MLLLRRISNIDRHYAHFKRYVQIIDQLVRFGFTDVVMMLHVRVPHFRKKEKSSPFVSRPERVRKLLEALGPTYVKLGQILSTRPDLIPLEYVNEFSKLQDKVDGFPFSQVEAIFNAEFGCSIDQIYSSFEERPFAAASIGQVHLATLLNGDEVVVKVQRPGIRRKIEIDLEIMYHIAARIEKSDHDLALLHPTMIVEEFAHVLRLELDYMVEAAHAIRFAEEMKMQDGVVVPKIYEEQSCSRILTMECLHGDSARLVIDDQTVARNYNLPLVARRGANAVLEQIFHYGFFHADPHPGNIIIMSENRVGFIDFGMMGRVSEIERMHFMRAINCMLSRDYEGLAEVMLKLTIFDTEPDKDRLARDLADLVEANLYLSLEKLSLGRVLEALMKLVSNYHLGLRPNLYIMFKAIISLENLGRKLDPKLEIIELLKPFMRKMQLQVLDPRRYFRQAAGVAMELSDSFINFPLTLKKLIDRAAEGHATVQVEHHGWEPVLKTLNSVCNRLASAMVLSAMIVGSSLIVLSGIPPKWQNVPLIGIIGFILSGIMGMILLRRTNRASGKH